ncbi:hypothetical protein [Streptomyces sp. NBC_00503]|uniref:hypothetical protein n=1 Tax=Streptomyces sp. NBC_00503 TaxID=2903659 RepID=UPI002E800701|nr:hypothetical protein [Streptomyces sp. NBC_00503]WUD85483.1 hypothetical protein OG490_35750 [Streptomyces sp. NBC_00503]
MKRTSSLVIHVASAAATSLLALSATACTESGSGSPKDRSGGPVWVEGQGATEAAGFMRVRTPAGATEVKGAVQHGFQDTTYLIAFTAPAADVEAFVADMRPEEPLRANTPRDPKTYTPATPWSHLGLPEPETEQRVRTASVCPPCIKDERRSTVQSVTIFVQDVGDGRARVYLKAF